MAEEGTLLRSCPLCKWKAIKHDNSENYSQRWRIEIVTRWSEERMNLFSEDWDEDIFWFPERLIHWLYIRHCLKRHSVPLDIVTGEIGV